MRRCSTCCVHSPLRIRRTSSLAFWAAMAPILPGLFPNCCNPSPALSRRRRWSRRRKNVASSKRLAQFVTRLAVSTEAPLLLVIEDLHWSDDTSLEFLLFLARRIPAQPILLLLTYRSDQVHPELEHFLGSLDRERCASEVSLRPLDVDQVDAMLRAIFHLDRPVRAEFVDALYSLTEGNPFFIEEVLKSLVASGDPVSATPPGRRRRSTNSEHRGLSEMRCGNTLCCLAILRVRLSRSPP